MQETESQMIVDSMKFWKEWHESLRNIKAIKVADLESGTLNLVGLTEEEILHIVEYLKTNRGYGEKEGARRISITLLPRMC